MKKMIAAPIALLLFCSVTSAYSQSKKELQQTMNGLLAQNSTLQQPSDSGTSSYASMSDRQSAIEQAFLDNIKIESAANNGGKLVVNSNFSVIQLIREVAQRNGDITLRDIENFKLSDKVKDKLKQDLSKEGYSETTIAEAINELNGTIESVAKQVDSFASQVNISKEDTVGTANANVSAELTEIDQQLAGSSIPKAPITVLDVPNSEQIKQEEGCQPGFVDHGSGCEAEAV